MIVSVRNARDRYLTATLKLAANAYAEMLLSSQMIKNISIKIFIYDKLDKNAYGYCLPEEASGKLRNFEIEIKRCRLNKMLKFLAHEMVHVKQFAKNELSAKNKNGETITLWHGKLCDIEHYWDQPWEIEAFMLEEEMLNYLRKGYQI